MIYERGNPDGPDINGNHTERVHLMYKQHQVSLPEKNEPVCRTGAWNILYSWDVNDVTCEVCLRKSGQKTP